MKNSALIQILKTFSKQEIAKFDKFLRSPYFTEGKRISSKVLYKYFRILKKQYPEFNEDRISNEKIFKELYRGRKYNDTIMRKLNSDMLHLTEVFFSYLEYENTETEFRHNLLVQLSKRKVEKVFLRKFRDMQKFLKELDRDEDYFYETYRTWQRYFSFYYMSKNIHKLEDTLKNTNNFFIYVVLGSLRIYLWAISFEKSIRKKSGLYLYDEILEHVKNNYTKYLEIPQIVFYYNLILLSSTREERYFYELKKLKKISFSVLSDMDKYNYFIMMTNFCNYMIRKGEQEYMKERFQIDRQFLSQELTDIPSGIHFVHFLEIARNAIKLGKLRWTEMLSKKLISRIEPNYRDFALNYTKALIEFERKNYDSSIELLSRLTAEMSRQKQYIRNLLIQNHFEKGEFETVLSLIDTSKHFLRREKRLAGSSRENFHNFITLTEKLLRLKERPVSSKFSRFSESLEELINVENKDWLMKKAGELPE